MPSLKTRLHDDLTTAMKRREELRTATLRMVLTAVTTEEVSGREARELSDGEVVRVLTRQAKQRREAADAYDRAARPELAARERDELAVLEGYLPAQLGDEELAALVAAAVAETGATSPRDMGKVMKVLGPRVAERAEGGRVAAAVRTALGS
jgi:hypothetical protein